MKKDDKASISLKRILIISLTCIMIFSAIAFATNNEVKAITIKYSNGEETQIITSKQTVSDILDENHIILLPEEYTYPSRDENVGSDNVIIISAEEIKKQEVAEKEETKLIEDILQSYTPIVEKIEVAQKEIPYDTVTEDLSGGAKETQKTVVEKGQNGIREVTDKVKYENDVETERVEIASVVIKEPVDRVEQVSRSSTRTSAVSYGNGTWSYSASDLDLLCAITAQECSRSYEGALAVITTACNRTVSRSWAKNGSDPLSQYKAPGQFCYSIDNHWRKRLNGNYADYVKQAVLDALNGKRNHKYLSFRTAGYATGEVIGGNVYFNSL